MAPTLFTGIDQSRAETLFTIEGLAFATDEPEVWILAQVAAGVISPKYRKGLQQFTRGAIGRLTALRFLSEYFGSKSPLPARIVKTAGPKIDRLYEAPRVYTREADQALSAAMVEIGIPQSAMCTILTPQIRRMEWTARRSLLRQLF